MFSRRPATNKYNIVSSAKPLPSKITDRSGVTNGLSADFVEDLTDVNAYITLAKRPLLRWKQHREITSEIHLLGYTEQSCIVCDIDSTREL